MSKLDEGAVLYLCDPDKNTECAMSNCIHRARKEDSWFTCDATFNPKYAQVDEDGKPIVSPTYINWMKRKNAARKKREEKEKENVS